MHCGGVTRLAHSRFSFLWWRGFGAFDSLAQYCSILPTLTSHLYFSSSCLEFLKTTSSVSGSGDVMAGLQGASYQIQWSLISIIIFLRCIFRLATNGDSFRVDLTNLSYVIKLQQNYFARLLYVPLVKLVRIAWVKTKSDRLWGDFWLLTMRKTVYFWKKFCHKDSFWPMRNCY